MNQTISPDVWIQITGVLIATLTFIIAQTIERHRDRKLARRDVYQKLEFASIDVFRFEADHLELIRPVWEKGKPLPQKGTAEYIAIMNYVCQMLNLFELAIKFRKDKTMPPDIFGSWVAWFFQLLCAPGFSTIWTDTRLNYLPQLRQIMDGGFTIRDEMANSDTQEELFYQYVAHVLQCDIIRDWNQERNPAEGRDFVHKVQQRTSANHRVKIDAIHIQWLNDPALADQLADLFIHNSGKHYISHGEIQGGRAISPTAWSDQLHSRLTGEFADALSHRPGQGSNIVGAYLENNLTGFMLVEFADSPDGPFATLSDIVVVSSLRHAHVGSSMVKWLVAALQQHQIRFLFAESNRKNEGAHQFLEQNGFEPISNVFLKQTQS